IKTHAESSNIRSQRGPLNEESRRTYFEKETYGMTKLTTMTEIGAFLREQHKDELAQEVFVDALIAMREIDRSTDFVQALITLAQYLPPPLLTDALGMTQEIAKREDRARVLSALDRKSVE